MYTERERQRQRQRERQRDREYSREEGNSFLFINGKENFPLITQLLYIYIYIWLNFLALIKKLVRLFIFLLILQ